MKVAAKDPRDSFSSLIDLDKTRINLFPHIVFICGGKVDAEATTNHSIRNMFMNLSGALEHETEGFRMAESFKSWERGYKDLSEFEKDIAAISTLVVVFLESAGSLAEFGLFFANSEIRSKLVVVVHSKYHEEESFIKLGMLSPLEENDPKAVLVFDINHEKIDDVDVSEVEEILADIVSHCGEKNQTEMFDKNKRGHKIFIVFQIVDLFSVLTKPEISKYLKTLEINISPKELDSALYILEQFELIKGIKKSSQFFYFVPSYLTERASFHFKYEINDDGSSRRYDSTAIKIEVQTYYRETAEFISSNRRRIKVIPSITEAARI